MLVSRVTVREMERQGREKKREERSFEVNFTKSHRRRVDQSFLVVAELTLPVGRTDTRDNWKVVNLKLTRVRTVLSPKGWFC